MRFIGESLGDSIGKYSGICQAQSTGRLYATPWNGQRILEIDASASGCDNRDRDHLEPVVTKVGESFFMGGAFCCLCEGRNGKLYAAPHNATKVVEIDPEPGAIDRVRLVACCDDTQDAQYRCIVASSNGKLFAAPFKAKRFLEISPATASCSTCEDLPAAVQYLARAAHSGEFSDVTIVVGGEKFHGHRLMLGRLPVFKAMFCGEFNERNQDEIVLKDLLPNIFRHVWRAIYTGRTEIRNIPPQDLLELVEAAERFGLAKLKEQVAEHLTVVARDENHLNVQNIAVWVRKARLHGLPALMRVCQDYCAEHGADVLMSEEVCRCCFGDRETFAIMVQAATGKRIREVNSSPSSPSTSGLQIMDIDQDSSMLPANAWRQSGDAANAGSSAGCAQTTSSTSGVHPAQQIGSTPRPSTAGANSQQSGPSSSQGGMQSYNNLSYNNIPLFNSNNLGPPPLSTALSSETISGRKASNVAFTLQQSQSSFSIEPSNYPSATSSDADIEQVPTKSRGGATFPRRSRSPKRSRKASNEQ